MTTAYTTQIDNTREARWGVFDEDRDGLMLADFPTEAQAVQMVLLVNSGLEPDEAEAMVGSPEHARVERALVRALARYARREALYFAATQGDGLFVELPHPVTVNRGERPAIVIDAVWPDEWMRFVKQARDLAGRLERMAYDS